MYGENDVAVLVAGELMRSPLEVSQRMRNKQILHYEGDEKNFVCLLTRRFVDLILKQVRECCLINNSFSLLFRCQLIIFV
jgi:hypothetical protein